MRFDSWSLKNRPDQTVSKLNEMFDSLNGMKKSIKIMSEDHKNVIIIGNQPINPSTGKPYSFGIHTYQVLGDRLEEI